MGSRGARMARKYPPARPPISGNWLDRAIMAVAPAAGLKRIQARAIASGIVSAVERTAAGHEGTLSNWSPRRPGPWAEKRARESIHDRAEAIVENDAVAESAVSGIADNVAGTGIHPQSSPAVEILGITEEQAATVRRQAEYAWELFASSATPDGRSFWTDQYQAVRSLLTRGEFIRVPVASPQDASSLSVSPFSFVLQSVDPLRVHTPPHLRGVAYRDGVEIDRAGVPVGLHIFSPAYGAPTGARSGGPGDYVRVPARIGHLRGYHHVINRKNDEQYRGVSAFSPCLKLFRDLSDYVDYELVGAIVASSIPIFIETADPYAHPTQRDASGNRYTEFAPGGVYYGSANERPHLLKSERPSAATFDQFVTRLIRNVGAALGVPYEVVAKDFSKTNYSSARAALLEAWRTFRRLQGWLIDGYCQPVWERVFEEAVLLGLIRIPAGAPDFYAARHAWTRAYWIPPRRGHVDPTKEIQALILGLEADLVTMAEAATEMGGDAEEKIRTRARERALQRELNPRPDPEPTPGPAPSPSDDDADQPDDQPPPDDDGADDGDMPNE